MAPPEVLAEALADRYRLERELGAGGMATVYLARDLKHDRLVAVKVLRPELASIVGTDRFLREIRITARLTHPHILPLLDSGEAGGFLYYVAPYVDGESLRERLQRERRLPVAEACRIARDVADALACAHESGVVHRDIKPENILFARDEPIVADFGIARALVTADDSRLTETGLAIGTPAYMSPEQSAGEGTVDQRADVYSLACVLYEMLAGVPPHIGPNAQAVLARRLTEPAPRLRTVRADVPAPLEQAIGRALARTPSERFPSVAAFAAAIAPPEAAPRGRASRLRWLLPALAALLVVGLVVAGPIARRTPRTVVASASHMLVLPFTPSGPDTALARLGRDLVFTLSAELDGLGDISVVDAHTVLAQGTASALGTEDAAALAQRFGAGSVLRGSLVRTGDRVRADFVLLPTGAGGAPLARGSAAAPLDSVAALTDSTVHALLPQVWMRGSAPTPSLEAALRTRSAGALRAFLEGEQHMVAGRWKDAASAYDRAHASDGAFALAAAREAYALFWSLQDQPDSLLADLRTHRDELPEAERLGSDAILHASADSLGRTLEDTYQLVQRHPDSWFGWLVHADWLLHAGPLLGHAPEEARAAFERALSLNPNLIPAHEHLILLALRARDTSAALHAYSELDRLGAGPAMTEDGYGTRMLQYRFLLAITRGDSTGVAAMVDSIATDPAPAARYSGSFYDPYRYGYFREQLRVGDRAARLGQLAGRDWLRQLQAFSWVGLGRWDSAVGILDRLAKEGDSTAAMGAYRLAVVGAWLGSLDADVAVRRRDPAARAAVEASHRAEFAWLDGVLGVARHDRRAVSAARTALAATPAAGTQALERSLAALEQGLAGDSNAAGAALAALEWEQAALASPAFVGSPFTIAVDRIGAARWLAAAGDVEQAKRLLHWADGAFLLHPSTVPTLMLRDVVARERAEIARPR